MQSTPTPEVAKEQYEERLETLNNPETPTPTQVEADAMKTGEYVISRETQRRDMRPEAEREPYKTR
jgi:hypothetical protein